ncbi:hypothetical protein BR93DRAFT_400575 [Coniochaeta sp. PMI_546]|nr:hypothetical protein BR93DRAFT_400575 [Coniochaeta sp. PMI_546]
MCQSIRQPSPQDVVEFEDLTIVTMKDPFTVSAVPSPRHIRDPCNRGHREGKGNKGKEYCSPPKPSAFIPQPKSLTTRDGVSPKGSAQSMPICKTRLKHSRCRQTTERRKDSIAKRQAATSVADQVMSQQPSKRNMAHITCAVVKVPTMILIRSQHGVCRDTPKRHFGQRGPPPPSITQ